MILFFNQATSFLFWVYFWKTVLSRKKTMLHKITLGPESREKVLEMDYLKLVWNVWNIRSVWNAGKSLENGLFKTG